MRGLEPELQHEKLRVVLLEKTSDSLACFPYCIDCNSNRKAMDWLDLWQDTEGDITNKAA